MCEPFGCTVGWPTQADHAGRGRHANCRRVPGTDSARTDRGGPQPRRLHAVRCRRSKLTLTDTAEPHRSRARCSRRPTTSPASGEPPRSCTAGSAPGGDLTGPHRLRGARPERRRLRRLPLLPLILSPPLTRPHRPAPPDHAFMSTLICGSIAFDSIMVFHGPLQGPHPARAGPHPERRLPGAARCGASSAAAPATSPTA
ncbi:MAG: hypothetical protein MZW92_34345 [Comamonadaceae bacterium]|nr:hypothetical protein [Comamonadaceae bacterium]